MSEGGLPAWLQVALLVMLAFFVGRWSARRDGRAPDRYQPPSPTYSAAASPHDRAAYNTGAGIDVRGLDARLEADLRGLLGKGHKIEAIKLARERLGLGLKEAKDLVESL